MPDESTPELARQWLEKATEDLEAARRLTDLPHVCSFHCQQAAEKGIKALLVLREVEFARTHDIDILLRQLGDQGLSPGHIDSEDLLDRGWLSDVRHLGIGAGTSTPGKQIDEVAQRIAHLHGGEVVVRRDTQEDGELVAIDGTEL